MSGGQNNQTCGICGAAGGINLSAMPHDRAATIIEVAGLDAGMLGRCCAPCAQRLASGDADDQRETQPAYTPIPKSAFKQMLRKDKDAFGKMSRD